MRAPILAVALLALLQTSPQLTELAIAAPTLEVRARTVVQLKPIVRSRGGITISGTVTDRASPEPISGVTVVVSIDGSSYTAVSDDLGRFTVTVPADEGLHTINVAFNGDRFLDPSSHTLEDFDVSNEPLELSLSADPTDDDGWELVVRAQAAGAGADVSVVLWGGDVSAPQLSRLGEITTDARGRASKRFSRDQLGGFGDKRIEARFTGDDTYDAATAQATFSIGAKTNTTLSIADSDIAFEATIRGTGRVTDEDGKPLARHRVVLEAGDKELDETTTDKSGGFKVEVEASELGEGTFSVQAVVYPSARWLSSSRSKPIAISIGDQKPVPLGPTIAAFGATCLALLGFVAMRTKPWTKWFERFGRREPEAATKTNTEQKRRAPGLVAARPSLVSTLRRPSDFGFSGHVFDVVTGRAVRGAHVKVLSEAGEKTDTSDHQGSFAIEDLPGGEWKVIASAHGYMPESFSVVVPHKGELRNARVDLLSVREHIFDLYGELARPLLPGDDRWGVWTPRQIFEHVRTTHRAGAFRDLTDLVEELYFSARTPDVDAVAKAQAQIDAVRRELVGPALVMSPAGSPASSPR